MLHAYKHKMLILRNSFKISNLEGGDESMTVRCSVIHGLVFNRHMRIKFLTEDKPLSYMIYHRNIFEYDTKLLEIFGI